MRKALFAVVLVAASFAGGAVVNGPGLRWAQTVVMSRLGLEEEEADHVPTPAAAPPESEVSPSRPIPPLVAGPPESKPAPAPAPEKPSATPGPHAPEPSERTRAEEPTPAPKPQTKPTPEVVARVPELSPMSSADAPPPLLPPEPLPTSLEPRPTPKPKPEEPAQSGRDRDADVRLASLPDTAKAAEGDASMIPVDPADWLELRRTMRALGVSRYGLEGEPGGRVRFHCVIPLAGRRAVGQHFEAEGDDDLQAAQAALRRVALWRAAEAEGRAP